MTYRGSDGTRLICAVGSPLTADDNLHLDGFAAHLEDQWRPAVEGVLVGGTMGLMQLLPEPAYRQLVTHAAKCCAGRGELLVGVGDTSFARTRDRIRLLNDLPVDGAVALSPFLVRFSQAELADYFEALAGVSKHPLFLYDLPVLVGVKLELPTVLRLAKHPNIAGIKCSCDYGWTRQLQDLAPARFRVIVASADLVDVLAHHGVREQLDGIFSVAPHWSSAIAEAANAGDWELAAAHQRRLSTLLRVVKQYGVFQSMTAILNGRGIPGNFAPAPMRVLSDAERASLLDEPIVRDLLKPAPQTTQRAQPVAAKN